MQRLEEIGRFHPAKSGDKLVLDTDKRRMVRLELNTEGRVRLELETAQDIRFLAHVEGRDTITFVADGPCVITPEGDGEIWWFTPEMETTSAIVEDVQTFTTIMERRTESPEMTAIRRMVREGELRREQALAFEIEKLRAADAARKLEPVVPAEDDGEPDDEGDADPAEADGGTGDSGGQGDRPPKK